jgi:hypothetical protein
MVARRAFAPHFPSFIGAVGDRVKAEPVSIVHVVVSAEAPENGLAKLPDKTVTTILPTTGVRGANHANVRFWL